MYLSGTEKHFITARNIQMSNLHETFAESQYGQDLVTRTRFNDFKPDWTTTEQWCNLLGPDVNNLGHMPHTQGIAAEFSAAQNLDTETSRLLATTAITHDWGEAIIGDIALPAKTEEDEKREQVAYRQIAYDLLGEQMGEDLTTRVWSVLNKTNSEAGDMFRAIEYIGYCTTALRAGKAAVYLATGVLDLGIERARKEQLTGGLLGMAKAVEVHNFTTLKGYAEKYPGVREVIQARL
jgi:hypothetical protein